MTVLAAPLRVMRLPTSVESEPNRIDDAEDGARRTDTKTQREDDDGRERGRLAHCAQRIAKVLSHRLEDPNAARVARLLLVPLDTAERQQCRAPCVVRQHAEPLVLLLLALDVELYLVGQLPLDAVAAEDGAQSASEPMQERHG